MFVYPIGAASFNPSMIEGMTLWLDGTNPGTTENRWDDQSGNNLHFTAASGTAYPDFSSGYASFDGVNTNLAGPSFSGYLSDGAEMFTLIRRYSNTGETNYTGWCKFGTSIFNAHYAYAGNVTTEFCRATTSQVNLFHHTTDNVNLAEWNSLAVWSVNGDLGCEVNGVAKNSTTTNAFGVPTTTRIGFSHNTAYKFRGDIKHFVIYNRKLTSDERAEMHAWMQAQ